MHVSHGEPHGASHQGQSNWLRAGVLGANDGIVSVAALVAGVAAATTDMHTLLITSIAGTVAGAFSMSVGEYVSVSSQLDTERALLAKEKYELEHFPKEELEELTNIYEAKGLSRATAETVANELTAHDAFAAHVEAELRINPDDLTNPWHAAVASWISFVIGAIIPVAAMFFPPEAYRVEAIFGGVVLALMITGYISAKVSDASPAKVISRITIGGVVAMAITYGIGTLFQLNI